jgi:hypothetical protein
MPSALEGTMKLIALCLALCLLLTVPLDAALAQSRPSTTNRPCSVNRQSVAVNGAIVLGTGGYSYDRFVANRSFCEFDEGVEPAWVPSRDMSSCFVGYRCKSRDRFWND